MNLHRVLAVFFRYLYVLRKGPQQLSDLFYWPLIDILLWGLTCSWIQLRQPEPNLTLAIMTGLIFWQVVWRGSIDISISILQEFWHRNLINLFSTPLKLREWICGLILFDLAKLLVTLTFGISTIYFLYSLNVASIGWSFIPFVVCLLFFGWTLGFLAASAIIYWGDQVEAISRIIGLLFAPFSAVFYPVYALPSWVQIISWSLPTTYIFEAMRALVHHEIFPVHYVWASLSLNTIYLTFSILLFRKMFEKSRMKGLARLE